MSSLNLSLVYLKRDWRAGELRLIALALIIATASLTSVSFFTHRINLATEIQATELLAADLVIRSGEPIEPALIEQAKSLGLKTTLTVSFRSVMVVDDKFELAEVKAVAPDYPLRGQMRISEELFSEEMNHHAIPLAGHVWPDARLLQMLDVQTGARISLGASNLIISRVLTYEPDRGGDMFNIAPRLLMNIADLEATELLQPGSRAAYRLLVAGASDALANFREVVERRKAYRVQGIRDARPELRVALDRAEQFLGLAVLVSLALAGLAIALSAQQYAVRHFDNCAIMRCFGAQQNTIIKIYTAQLFILAIGCSAIGCLLGYVGQEALVKLMSGMLLRTPPKPSLTPIVLGMSAGVVTALGFAMPQMLRLKNVTPLRVLRRDLMPLPLGNLSIYAAAICALLLLTPWQSGNAKLTFYGFIGLLISAIALFFAARLGIHALRPLRFKVGIAPRFGLANIIRRGKMSSVQILAIGLGIMALTLLTLIRTDLLANWRNRLPDNTPNYFLINIQPDDVKRVTAFIKQEAGLATQAHPMIRARLMAINNTAIHPDDYEDERARRLAGRVFNLSVAKTMPADNRLLQGEWWGETEDNLFSFEDKFAATLKIAPGDELKFKIADREVSGTVTNTRWVDWDTFNVNFFAIANPGTLDGYPATYISSFYLPSEDKQVLIDLIKTFPGLTIFDVDSILKQVRQVMEQVLRAVEFVFIFTLLTGIIVLLSALQTTHDERRYESALLITLGAGRNHVLGSLLTEFAFLGLIAGVIAALTATVSEILLARYVFRIEVVVNFWIWLIVPLLCTFIIVSAGLLGTRKVLSTPPMVALRQAG